MSYSDNVVSFSPSTTRKAYIISSFTYGDFFSVLTHQAILGITVILLENRYYVTGKKKDPLQRSFVEDLCYDSSKRST